MHQHKAKLRALLAVSMIAIGVLHFVRSAFFVAMIPKALPEPLLLVYVSGFFEIAGGVGVLVRRTRRLAGLGLVLLYVAVFPANINMAIHQIQPEGVHIPVVAMWLRLPFQILFILWAWWCSRDDGAPRFAAPAA